MLHVKSIFAFVSESFKKLDLHKKLSLPPYAETDMMTPLTSFPLIVMWVLFCLFASTVMISLLNAIEEKPICKILSFIISKSLLEYTFYKGILYIYIIINDLANVNESLEDINSNLTPNAYKNKQLITQRNINLLDGHLVFNEIRFVSLATVINSPIESNGMALHTMYYTDSTYFTNIVTLFILDSSETWHNYYHRATQQWTGWVKS